MADWSGLPLRRELRSAECFSEVAMDFGLSRVNTSGSRSSALLCLVTVCDHLRFALISAPRGCATPTDLQSDRKAGPAAAAGGGLRIADLEGLADQLVY